MDRVRHKAMLKRLSTSLLVWLVAIGTVAGEVEHGDQVARVVGTPAGRVRAREIPVAKGGRFIKGSAIRWVPESTVMRFFERKTFGNEGEWFNVELPDGHPAWITARYLQLDIARDRLVVLPGVVNIRQQASVGSRVIGKATKGTVLGLVRERNGWSLALLPDGKRGWIRNDMVRHEPLAPKAKPKTAAEPPPEPKLASSPDPQDSLPEIDYAQRARELADEFKHGEAVEAFEEALKKEPNNGVLHFDAAKSYEALDDKKKAIVYYRRALRGKPSRPEAQFYLDRLLKKSDEGEPAAAPAATAAAEVVGEGAAFEFIGAYAVYLLPALALGAFAAVIILVVVSRRQRAGQEHPMYRRRQADGGFDAVLKYAVEKRPLIREIEEAEKKLAEMDEALRKRVDTFGSVGDDGRPALPSGESAEALLAKVEGLRKTILNQEERSRIYADLVYLQNEKIQALDEEIEALKKLIKLDYAEEKLAKKVPSEEAVSPETPAAKKA